MALFFVRQTSAAGGGDPTEGKKFSWGRALPAMIFLVIIFVAGAYCAHDDKLSEWSTVLLHSFEILLGGLVGMIVGEKAAS
jgi:hypothetical protein